MKKKILALAMAASLFAAGAAQADWQAGTENKLFVGGGQAAARMSLTAQQTLKTSVDTAAETATLVFMYGDTAEEDGYTLTLPLYVASGNGVVTVQQIVDTGNQKRFYIVETGAPGGCLLVSYANKNYATAFDAADIEGNWDTASIEVQKKSLVLHLTDAEGNAESRTLTYDKKQNVFTADGVSVSTVTVVE